MPKCTTQVHQQLKECSKFVVVVCNKLVHNVSDADMAKLFIGFEGLSGVGIGEMADNFGQMMKTRRLQLGLSQGQVGEALGHDTHHQVQRWEAGTRPIFVEDVGPWADALKMSRKEALRKWVESKTGEELTYDPDPDSIPIPEGRNDDDQSIRSAATLAAQETYKVVAEALREARQKSPGTIGFAPNRYETSTNQENAQADEPINIVEADTE